MGGRALRNVFLGPLAYGGAGTVFWMGMTVLSIIPNAYGLPEREIFERLILAGYLAFLATGWSTLGFIVATTPWRSWRSQPTLRVVLLSAGLGLFASLFPIAGIALIPHGLPSIIRKAPLLGVALTYSSPGILCGLLGFFLSQVLPGGTPVEKRA